MSLSKFCAKTALRPTFAAGSNARPEPSLHSIIRTSSPSTTSASRPPGTSKALFNPSLSPDGDRLVFGRVDREGVGRLWISSLSGGVPVLLTNSDHTLEVGGSWSPDGSRFVYVAYEGG